MSIVNHIIEYKRKEHIIKMWELIDYIGWGVKTTDYKTLRKKLFEEFSDKDMKKLRDFCIFQRKELQNILTTYEKKNNLGNFYVVGDDGYWDLTAHIVGLGKVWYDRVIDNPNIAREISINQMYKENFEYSLRPE